MSRTAAAIDADAFRADQIAAADQGEAPATGEPAARPAGHQHHDPAEPDRFEELPDRWRSAPSRSPSPGRPRSTPDPNKTPTTRLPSGPGGRRCSGRARVHLIPSTRTPPAYGRVTAEPDRGGPKPGRRAVDLMIAATAIAAELPLYTTNPGDFAGLITLVTVIPVTRPEVPDERLADL